MPYTRLLCLALLLAACGDDDDDDAVVADAAPRPDVALLDAAPVDAPTPDAPALDAAPVDAGPDATPLNCSFSSADYGDLGAVTTKAFFLAGSAGPDDDIAWATALVEAGMPSDSLEVELYAGYGAFTDGLAPGTYTIEGDDTAYATCGLCVLIKTNLVTTSNFEDTYLATSGTVTITQLGDADGEALALTLSDIELAHVVIMDGVSTPASACTTHVGSASLSGTMQ